MKRIAVIICICCLLGGCSKKAPVCRVVTGIDVEYQHSGGTIRRVYTQNDSISSLLNYLRLLRPYGPVIPGETKNATCRIVLQYSDGPDTVYFQRGYDYLQKDDGHWQKIDKERAVLLYPLLLLMPSDVSSESG